MNKKDQWKISPSSLSHLKNDKRSEDKMAQHTKKGVFGLLDFLTPQIGSPFKAKQSPKPTPSATPILPTAQDAQKHTPKTATTPKTEITATEITADAQPLDTLLTPNHTKPTTTKTTHQKIIETTPLTPLTHRAGKPPALHPSLPKKPVITPTNTVTPANIVTPTKNLANSSEYAWLGVFLIPIFMIGALVLFVLSLMALFGDRVISGVLYAGFMMAFIWLSIKFGTPSKDASFQPKHHSINTSTPPKGKIGFIGYLVMVVGGACLLFLGLLILAGVLLNEAAQPSDYGIGVFLAGIMVMIALLMRWLVNISRKKTPINSTQQ